MSMSTRHKHTPKGRFVLRADSIRPYSLGGEAAAIQRTALLRSLREAKSLPYGASALCNSFRGGHGRFAPCFGAIRASPALCFGR